MLSEITPSGVVSEFFLKADCTYLKIYVFIDIDFYEKGIPVLGHGFGFTIRRDDDKSL